MNDALEDLLEGERKIEERELLGDIGGMVAHFAPVDCAGVTLAYRAMGEHTELSVLVRRVTDYNLYSWTPPAVVAEHLDKLRAVMYRRGRGTWFELTGTVAFDGAIDVRYWWDDNPNWREEPPVSALVEELERFPRDAVMVPEWMADRLSRPVIATLEDAVYYGDVERRVEGELAELGVDPRFYRIRDVADGAWCMVPTEYSAPEVPGSAERPRWAVFLAFGEKQLARAEFATFQQAVRYFFGHLVLHLTAFRDERAPYENRPTEEWPIQPVGGDRGLDNYSGKKLITVTPGTEIDRYGDLFGNTVFAARTEFPYRSQPAEEADLPYRIYRVHHSIRAVMGQVVASHDQPGGGTAYVLERPLNELLYSGALVEITQATTSPADDDTD
ncbi:TNT domain-containing protein [Saccharomonospora xinjiangensis]|uniref:TNT domain-containing protein n=1 Tax=Saccharomonospora xinjiangensis TaxID=75294 RepID=UPI00106F4145|nr:TNT domain-containing protein [Saccharomonospora xinjiangensis]QBQ60979.1 hypothetical protein EYD13_13130 [Saccharomonospora xinjiangensis]